MTGEVHVISDVVCPWCYVGKRRLEKALETVDGEVPVRWLPFELNPGMPAEGMEREAYRMAKFGSREKSRELDARLEAVGKEVGIDFAFDHIERTPNTFDAHRLLWWAEQQGAQQEVAESLFRVYFCEGRDIGDRAVLKDVAAEHGLDAAGLIAGDEGAGEVRADLDTAKRLRVQGVPFFIFNQKLAVSGAQPPEILRAALQEASEGS